MFDLDRWEEIWHTISRNRKRSIMTAFGVFWGIFMLVVMTGAGLGLKRTIMSNVGEMSTNTCFFFPNPTAVPYKGMQSGRWWEFRNDDVAAIKKQVPGVKYAAGMMWGRQGNFSYKDKKGEYSLMGYMPDYQKIDPQQLRFGRFINDLDIEQQRKVCVIGAQVWKNLFPGGENPVGETIKMNGMYVTVVGVMIPQGGGIQFSDPEQTVAIPFSLMQQMYNRGDRFDGLAVTGKDNVSAKEMEEEIRTLLMNRHIISPEDTKAIGGFNIGEQFEQIANLFFGIMLLTWIVGAGTLLAGVVGVSNIMLVVIRERTQEIGVRRAIGAPPRAIIMQIMSESFVLTFVAGVVGLACGVGVLSAVDSVLQAKAAGSDMPPSSWQITFGAAMLSGFVLVAGSLIAGIIPANRAMRIKPVDAIREE